jgi:hypothetical protein
MNHFPWIVKFVSFRLNQVLRFIVEPAPSRRRLRGLFRSEPDLRIAAIALQHGLTIVTGNIRHFTDIPGLSAENWLI